MYNNGGDGINSHIIENCSIHDNGGNGASASIVTNSSIFNNKGYGVSLMESVLSKCSVYNNSAGGVLVNVGCSYRNLEYPDSYVQDAQIYYNLVGIQISSQTGGTYCQTVTLHVSNCTINDNFEGGIVTDELFKEGQWGALDLVVSHTLIESNGKFGIRFNATIVDEYNNPLGIVHSVISEMSECTITNQTVGALGTFGSVTSSNITGNSQIGLDVFKFDGWLGGVSVVTDISQNNIYDNGVYNIKSHFPFGQDLNATMNWWGTTNTTEIEASIYDYYDDYNLSRVQFEPFLTTPIPEFPSLVVLPLFIIASLLAVAVFRRKSIGQWKLHKE